HRRRLIRNLAQLHPQRQRLLQSGELTFQGLAEDQDIAAGLHRHRNTDGVLAHETHARRGWIVEATLDLGHIGDAEGAVTDANGKVANFLYRLEAPGHAQLNTLAGRFEEPGSRHRVLRLQRLLYRRQRQAEGGQLGVGQLDPDLLVLQPDQFDLADVLDPLQLQLQPVGVVLEHGVVEAIAGQRIDVAESGAEFIVEERPLDTGRQCVANVADLLAHLIPKLGYLRTAHGVTRHEGDLRLTRTGKAGDAVILAGLHQLLLDAFGDLARHLFGTCPRPVGANHHGLEGEGRVFTLSQLGI